MPVDHLHHLLTRFNLRARIFQTGVVCHSAHYDEEEGLGYLHVIRKGTIHIETERQPSLSIDQPSLLFYMNPTTHRILPQGNGADMVCASFEFGYGLGNPLYLALPKLIHLELRDAPGLSLALNLMFNEAQLRHSGRQAILDRMIEVIILQLLRELIQQKKIQSGLLAGLADPKLAKSIHAMHAHPARSWSLENLADQAGMSRARFAAKFHEIVGVPPGRFLSEWRIRMAQTELRQGKSLQKVSMDVGYSSASALSRAFTAQIGIAPLAWLKQDSLKNQST